MISSWKKPRPRGWRRSKMKYKVQRWTVAEMDFLKNALSKSGEDLVVGDTVDQFFDRFGSTRTRGGVAMMIWNLRTGRKLAPPVDREPQTLRKKRSDAGTSGVRTYTKKQSVPSKIFLLTVTVDGSGANITPLSKREALVLSAVRAADTGLNASQEESEG